jgi:transcriptional regulator GlxA family with amidase domain
LLRDQPLARLWARHLADGYALADALSPAAATLFARHSVDLLAQALEERQHPHPAVGGVARRRVPARLPVDRARIRRSRAHAGPARLGTGVSTRTLARIFADRGESVMRRIYDERVRQAARLLTEAGAAHRSVTEIAFACGFNDASHFGRAFAARMHVTPTRWRRQG